MVKDRPWLIIVLALTVVLPTKYVQDFEAHVQPDDITCGPTSVFMVLNYAGKSVPFEQIAKSTKTRWFSWYGTPYGFTLPRNVAATLRQYGIDATEETGDMEKLKQLVCENRLPIVLLRSGRLTWHYSVVIGYTSDAVCLADPGRGEHRWVAKRLFLESWAFVGDDDGDVFAANCRYCRDKGISSPIAMIERKCVACGDSGTADDLLSTLVQLGRIRKKTMIVPKKPLSCG